MQTLLASGTYTTSDNDPLVPVIRRLKTRGVLIQEDRVRSRNYRLAPDYQNARNVLRSNMADGIDL